MRTEYHVIVDDVQQGSGSYTFRPDAIREARKLKQLDPTKNVWVNSILFDASGSEIKRIEKDYIAK